MARRQRVCQNRTTPPPPVASVCVSDNNYDSDDSSSGSSMDSITKYRVVKLLLTKLRKRSVWMLLILVMVTFSLMYDTFSNHKMQDISRDSVSEDAVSDDEKSAISKDTIASISTTREEEENLDTTGNAITAAEDKDNKDEIIGDDKDCVLLKEPETDGYYDTENAPKLTGKAKADDTMNLGRCHYDYPIRTPPENGYLGGIDFYFFRNNNKKWEECFLNCIDRLERDEIDDTLLVEAAVMGLTQVAKKLKNKYHLNPLTPGDFRDRPNLNAIQEAIRGGYAEMVQILSNSNNDLVIDNLGRTVKDYVTMKASAILPKDAKKYLNLDTTNTATKSKKLRRRLQSKDTAKVEVGDSGWLHDPNLVPNTRCDMDVLDDMTQEQFYNDYFVTGRPFVLRGQVPLEEIRAFDKSRWETTKRFNSTVKVSVGPSAYPSLTGQKECKKSFKISDVEKGKECKEQPGVPMLHARHPSWDDLKDLYPRYNGDIYHETGGFRFLRPWFGEGFEEDDIGTWQVFFGGDDSGATFHWHPGAFNALYVGVKDWAITPPLHRGFTGMPARDASKLLNDSIAMRCTQLPGDIMYIPDYWGHLTLNRGFSIGAAMILHRWLRKSASAGEASTGAGAVESNGVKPVAVDEKKIFFVHINKSGGTSMIQMLSDRCKNQYLEGDWGDGKRSFRASVRQFIDRYGRYEWDSANSFAVVRHPLARQVSNFFSLVGDCAEKGENSICTDRLIPKKMDLKKLSDEEKIEAFHDYIAKLYEKYPPGSKRHYRFGSRAYGNEEYDTFNATQTSWLVDASDKIVVNDIFHLEDISKDMSKLADKFPCLKGEESNMEASKRRLKEGASELKMLHLNPSPDYPDYKLFGKNKQTNRIMKEVYEVDFRNFGYKL